MMRLSEQLAEYSANADKISKLVADFDPSQHKHARMIRWFASAMALLKRGLTPRNRRGIQ
jgi:hypothetical protein